MICLSVAKLAQMKFEEIQRLIKEYNTVKGNLIDYKMYALYALTHHSTAIEGSTLSESEVIDLLFQDKTTENKPFEHHLMVADYFAAIKYVLNHAQEKKVASLDFIQKVNSLVMKNTGGMVNTVFGSFDMSMGNLRLSNVRAGNRRFPDHSKVTTLLQEFLSEFNERIGRANTLQDKLELSFWVHFELVSIHPFGDGNGRTSRLLMNFVQEYFDLPLGIVYKNDKLSYFNALEKTRTEDNLAIFYQFMLSQYVKFLRNEIEKVG